MPEIQFTKKLDAGGMNIKEERANEAVGATSSPMEIVTANAGSAAGNTSATNEGTNSSVSTANVATANSTESTASTPPPLQETSDSQLHSIVDKEIIDLEEK